MLDRLRRLFGIEPPAREASAPGIVSRDDSADGQLQAGSAEDTRNASHRSPRDPDGADDVIDRYFHLAAEIEKAKRDRDFAAAAKAARATYPILRDVVRRWKREYRSFDISTSHAVHTAPTLMAVIEDREGIRELRAALEATDELREWLSAADQAESDLHLVPRIVATINDEPGVLQSTLKGRLGLADGSQTSRLASWLEKAGRLYRVKKGSTYQLYPTGYVIPVAASRAVSSGDLRPADLAAAARQTPREVANAAPIVLAKLPRPRTRRGAQQARVLDFSGLPIVRLPMAPPSWEEREEPGRTGVARKSGRRAEPRFVVDGNGWQLGVEETLAPAERPDPAFREVFHTGGYTHWLDPKGKREGFAYAHAVLRVTDRTGRVTAERGLAHDGYRSDVNVDGTGILFLSREGVLHGYTGELTSFIEERIADMPEYEAQAERLGIELHELKNHVRCVAISTDRSRYLVTIVDEAWCVNTAIGAIVWGFRMPTKEGWTREVAGRSERTGTSAEVQAALRLMQLDLPVSPEDVTQQYRKLVMRWHPDRNIGDLSATSRFQELQSAMALLTGADLSHLSARAVEQITYAQVLSTERFELDSFDERGEARPIGFELTTSLVVGEKFAADWIYAANIGGDGRAFLAGYSGKVVVVSPMGIPERVYDIGAVPRRIVEAGQHVYILTDTRLYVLAGDRLEALVDVYGASDVVVADRGFALLEHKAITWFTPDGRRVGTVRTKDPLRRAFWAEGALVVETRQHRAIVKGAAAWWGK
jgi:hypothetical protein